MKILVQIVSKHVLDENATSSAKRAREIGLNQFNSFINNRLWNGTASIYCHLFTNRQVLQDLLEINK